MHYIIAYLFIFCVSFKNVRLHDDGGGCVIDLGCEECLPEHPPAVTAPAPDAAGRVRLADGARLALSCRASRFLALPDAAALALECRAGRLRARGRDLHPLELGCREDLFEDALHPVAQCPAPLRGRAYRSAEAGGAAHHHALVCYDEDRAAPVRAHATGARLRLPAHDDGARPLGLLGDLDRAFDERTRRAAERLYADEERLTRRARELLRRGGARPALAAQTLGSAGLLAAEYFEPGEARVARFVSSRVAVWRGVAAGNLRHAQADVAAALRARRGGARPLAVHAGTHGVFAMRAEGARAELFLQPEGRFPVPRYVWTAVLDAESRRGVALVVLNDPFVAVSEIKSSVFCESICNKISWLAELRRNRNYETPLYGLVFCCAVHDFAETVKEMPGILLSGIPFDESGVLTDL